MTASLSWNNQLDSNYDFIIKLFLLTLLIKSIIKKTLLYWLLAVRYQSVRQALMLSHLYWMLSYLGSAQCTLIFIVLDLVIIGTAHCPPSLLWLSFFGQNFPVWSCHVVHSKEGLDWTALFFLFLYLICNHLDIFLTNIFVISTNTFYLFSRRLKLS